jgi:predicted MFS family arabinose efflux permease
VLMMNDQNQRYGGIWIVASVMAAVYTLNLANQASVSVLAKAISEELSLTNTELGWVLGLSYAALSAFLSLPIARYADGNSRTLVAGLGLALMGVASIIMSLADSFWPLMFGRALAGVGDAGLVAAALSYVAGRSTSEQRPTSLAIFNSGSGFGLIFGTLGLSVIAAVLGWRIALAALGIVSIILGFALAYWLPDNRPATKGEGDSNLLATIRELMSIPTYACLLFAFAAMGMSIGATVSWTMKALQGHFAMSQTDAGLLMSIGAGGATIVGVLIYGLIAGRMRRQNAAKPLYLAAILNLAGCWLYALAMLSNGGSTLVILLVSGFLLFACTQSAILTGSQEVCKADKCASAIAVMGCCFAFFGQGLATTLIGIPVDALQTSLGTRALPLVLAGIMLVLPLVTSFMLIMAARRVDNDLAIPSGISAGPVVPNAF